MIVYREDYWGSKGASNGARANGTIDTVNGTSTTATAAPASMDEDIDMVE